MLYNSYYNYFRNGLTVVMWNIYFASKMSRNYFSSNDIIHCVYAFPCHHEEMELQGRKYYTLIDIRCGIKPVKRKIACDICRIIKWKDYFHFHQQNLIFVFFLNAINNYVYYVYVLKSITECLSIKFYTFWWSFITYSYKNASINNLNIFANVKIMWKRK